MIKYLPYLTGLLLVLTSCEEYYHANLDAVDNLLVVESRICNDTALNYVRLTRTANFNDRYAYTAVSEANCEIQTEDGKSIPGVESSDGYFKFPFIPETGKKYKLSIKAGDDDYESDFEKMPPVSALDSIYAVIDTLKTYEPDAYGNPFVIETKGFYVRVDAPITDLNQYYRFSWRVVTQWRILPFMAPFIYNWESFYDNDGIFNIIGPTEYSTSNAVKSHCVIFQDMDYRIYLGDVEGFCGWIILIDQYGLSESSYSFYDQLNDQLEANGQMFDPVYTQIHGNMYCPGDKDKVVLGHFNVCSYKQHRYYVMAYRTSSSLRQRKSDNTSDIPDEGSFSNKEIEDLTTPDFWENPDFYTGNN